MWVVPIFAGMDEITVITQTNEWHFGHLALAPSYQLVTLKMLSSPGFLRPPQEENCMQD
jgi:hypothetical protein